MKVLKSSPFRILFYLGRAGMLGSWVGLAVLCFIHLSVPVTAATLSCSQLRLITQRNVYEQKFTALASQALEARPSIGPMNVKVGEQSYTVIKQLASSKTEGRNGDAYLARVDGEYVVIKRYTDREGQISARDLLNYEVYASEFLRERGFTVANPIQIDRQMGVIVKPLVKGLTVRDITSDSAVSEADANAWIVTHTALVNRMAAAFTEFPTWLMKKNATVYQQLLNSDISHWLTTGDFRYSAQSDLIFDVQGWEWVLLDP